MTPEALVIQRQEWRKERIAARRALPAAERAASDAILLKKLAAALAQIDAGVLAFYWPIQAEFDARPAMIEWLAQGNKSGGNAQGGARRAVLPVVIKRHQPLQFREWTPATVMQPAGFGTQVPSTGEWLAPTVLTVPLVGFDDAGYRLGYGGGYYDRTLASLVPRPRTIGIGYAAARLETIHPQSYDLKLDVIIQA